MKVNGNVWLVAESLLATGLSLYLSLRLGISSVWGLLPLVLLLAEQRSLEDYGFEARITPPSPIVHLAVGGAALALYGSGYFLLARFYLGQAFEPRLPIDFGFIVFHQLLAVAIPEEIFFRGYLQTNLDRVFGKFHRVLGAEVGAGLLAQAVLFAVCHLIGGDWTRLRVFVFALFVGWLRARSGSVVAPALYHDAANSWVAILESSFR